MIDLDKVMQRKDLRTVSSGEIRCLFAEIERLRSERDRLDSYLDHTADGKLVCECEKFFCPRCAGELRVVIDIAYCDDCPNPDDYGVPPMPWSLSMAYSTREAADAAESGNNG